METIIISLGGSLIIPEEIDVDFLKDFKKLILSQVEKGKRFFIVVGGGKICRKYQAVAKELSNPTPVDLDMIGIKALNLNAELVRILFKESKNVGVYGAENPGNSTDFVAVSLAKKNNTKKVINLSNTDYVYDSDPKMNPNAKKFEQISWPEYRAIIPKEWNPGLNSPFDPVASEMAQKEGMEVIIMNGKPIGNLANYLNGEKFQGTVIK
ncbi:MAG: UMP kinase [Candidatus Nomurabacteria bacterium]|nr:UMP kinase [Candidatus Nomurabacteria bacterium]